MKRCYACRQKLPCEVRRKITSAMARSLINLYRAARGDTTRFVYTQRAIVVDKGGDFAKLRHWDLIEAKRARRGDGSKRTGYYRITYNGVLFVKNKADVPKYIWFKNGHATRDGGGYVDIVSALGSKFDYAELFAS